MANFSKYCAVLSIASVIFASCSGANSADPATAAGDPDGGGDSSLADGATPNDAYDCGMCNDQDVFIAEIAADAGAQPDADVTADEAAPADVPAATDTQTPDIVSNDLGPTDAAAADAAIEDVAGADASVADSGPVDAGPGDSGPVDSGPVDAGKTPGIYGGHCEVAFPMPAKGGWNHQFVSPGVTFLGAPQHRIRDLILKPGEKAQLRGHFTYSVGDIGLSDENIELWVQTCPKWEKWATLKTDGSGIVFFDVPATLPQGDYRVKMVVEGDLTDADGVIAVWPKGMQVVVTDVDGTLTTSDWELISDVVFGKDAVMYPDSNTVMNAMIAKDYRIVYLTGRPQVVNRYTRLWLTKHTFPIGVLLLTESIASLPPTVDGVQKFKTETLSAIMANTGAQFPVGFGNAVTDIGAYQAIKIPNVDLYVVGPEAGKSGSTAITTYTDLLPKLVKYPNQIQP